MQSDGGPYTALVGFARVDASFCGAPALLQSVPHSGGILGQIDDVAAECETSRLCRLYAGDKRPRGSGREVIAARFFEVRDDKTLAVFD